MATIDGRTALTTQAALAATCEYEATHTVSFSDGPTSYYEETCDNRGVRFVRFDTPVGPDTMLLCATHAHEAMMEALR